MIAQFTIYPINSGKDSISESLKEVMTLIMESGLDYQVGPMSTAVEGEWNDVLELINRCRKTLLKKHSRVHIAITIDERKGAKSRIKGKVESLEKKLGKKINK